MALLMNCDLRQKYLNGKTEAHPIIGNKDLMQEYMLYGTGISCKSTCIEGNRNLMQEYMYGREQGSHAVAY